MGFPEVRAAISAGFSLCIYTYVFHDAEMAWYMYSLLLSFNITLNVSPWHLKQLHECTIHFTLWSAPTVVKKAVGVSSLCWGPGLLSGLLPWAGRGPLSCSVE